MPNKLIKAGRVLYVIFLGIAVAFLSIFVRGKHSKDNYVNTIKDILTVPSAFADIVGSCSTCNDCGTTDSSTGGGSCST